MDVFKLLRIIISTFLKKSSNNFLSIFCFDYSVPSSSLFSKYFLILWVVFTNHCSTKFDIFIFQQWTFLIHKYNTSTMFRNLLLPRNLISSVLLLASISLAICSNSFFCSSVKSLFFINPHMS